MNHQGFDENVQKWMYILIGRLLYEVNELDQWQVMPFLKGQAGTGKSTITGKICKAFYEYTDVGMLSNNSEKQFGLSSFYNKLLFIAPEIKNDLKVDQAEMQGIISGEDVVVAEKHKTAQMVEWKVPGIIAGNEVPGWIDNAGSISRRIVVFQFDKKDHHYHTICDGKQGTPPPYRGGTLEAVPATLRREYPPTAKSEG